MAGERGFIAPKKDSSYQLLSYSRNQMWYKFVVQSNDRMTGVGRSKTVRMQERQCQSSGAQICPDWGAVQDSNELPAA